MDKIKGGATLWARQTIESDIFYKKPHVWFKIWFYLVAEANHKDNKQFKRGSCFMKYEWIMKKTKAKKSEIDHCIRWLKSATMIATQKATRGFIVNIDKYDPYQCLENYKSETESDTIGELKAKQKRNKSDTINKNDKNEKNVNKREEKEKEREKETSGIVEINLNDVYIRIINYLNKSLSKINGISGKYRVTKPHKRLISARLKEGYAEKDFYIVIDKMIQVWGRDAKFRPYLRPQTLFCGKFDSYLSRIMSPSDFGLITPKSERNAIIGKEWAKRQEEKERRESEVKND